MVVKSSLSADQQYALEGLISELENEYIDPRYITEKLNKVFFGEAVFTYAPYKGNKSK